MNTHNRLRMYAESTVLYMFRPLFTAIYHILKWSPSVIQTAFYESYLISEIQKVTQSKLYLFDGKHRLPGSYGTGLSERCVEIPWCLNHLSGNNKLLLDAGSSLNFRELLFGNILRNKSIVISNLNPERNCYWEEGISYDFHDLRKPFFSDALFDEIVCISVLEHIGMDNRRYISDNIYSENKTDDYLRTVSEFRRILKDNGMCLITVPFGKRANHGWLQIFNMIMLMGIIRRFKPKRYSISFFKYHNGKWNISSFQECKDSVYRFDYPRKSFCVATEAVACVELKK